MEVNVQSENENPPIIQAQEEPIAAIQYIYLLFLILLLIGVCYFIFTYARRNPNGAIGDVVLYGYITIYYYTTTIRFAIHLHNLGFGKPFHKKHICIHIR